MSASRHGALVMAEMFKALRYSAMSAAELAEYLSMTQSAAHAWLRELEDNGMVCAEKQQRGLGGPTKVFRLSPEWGGVSSA